MKDMKKDKDLFVYYLTEEEKELLLEWFEWKDSQVGSGSEDIALVSYIKKNRRRIKMKGDYFVINFEK